MDNQELKDQLTKVQALINHAMENLEKDERTLASNMIRQANDMLHKVAS